MFKSIYDCLELCLPGMTPYPQHQGNGPTFYPPQTEGQCPNSHATGNGDCIVSIQPSIQHQMVTSKVEAHTVDPASSTTSPTNVNAQDARKDSHISVIWDSSDEDNGPLTPNSSSSDESGYYTPPLRKTSVVTSSNNASVATRSPRRVHFEEDSSALGASILRDFKGSRVREEPVRKLC